MRNPLFFFSVLPALLSANAMASAFDYTHLDVAYLGGTAETDTGDIDLDLEGILVKSRIQIAENFFAHIGYENGEIEADGGGGAGVDVWRLSAGLGGYMPICDSADVYYGVAYKFSELEAGGTEQQLGNVDLHVGIRWAPACWLEVNPNIEQSIAAKDDDFVDAVDSTTIGLNLYVTALDYVKPFAGISYELTSSDGNEVSDQLLYTAGLRFSF